MVVATFIFSASTSSHARFQCFTAHLIFQRIQTQRKKWMNTGMQKSNPSLRTTLEWEDKLLSCRGVGSKRNSHSGLNFSLRERAPIPGKKFDELFTIHKEVARHFFSAAWRQGTTTEKMNCRMMNRVVMTEKDTTEEKVQTQTKRQR
jgi:hypothetical protein